MDFSLLAAWKRVLLVVRQLHRDQEGAVTLETLLIIGAVALPVLIFTMKQGRPRVRRHFFDGLSNLENSSRRVIDGH